MDLSDVLLCSGFFSWRFKFCVQRVKLLAMGDLGWILGYEDPGEGMKFTGSILPGNLRTRQSFINYSPWIVKSHTYWATLLLGTVWTTHTAISEANFSLIFFSTVGVKRSIYFWYTTIPLFQLLLVERWTLSHFLALYLCQKLLHQNVWSFIFLISIDLLFYLM